MEIINLKAHTVDSTQIDAIKEFLISLKIKFEISKEKQSPYNPEFVEKILESEREIEEGKGIKLSIEEFKKLCK